MVELQRLLVGSRRQNQGWLTPGRYVQTCQLQANDRLIPLEVQIADSFLTRLVGLLGRAPAVGSGLLLRPCASVHTLGMRVPVDVAFLGADGEILKIVSGLPPWRYASCKNASQVIEASNGYLTALRLQPGDIVMPQRVFPQAGWVD